MPLQVFAQAIPGKPLYILVKGTLTVKGLSFFPSNAFPAHYGEYRVPQGPIRVWYCSQSLFFPESWKSVPGKDIALLEDAKSGIWAYKPPGYALFFSFPTGFIDRRAFILLFLSRFESFRKSAAGSAELSFPAILEQR
jgi:hypothetical protein